MADITKIVPTMITSNLTVSEVNGISLTKAKKFDESSLPTTSFAQILEAQLSQDNTPVEELQTETKQILPGQNVNSSLFGSLIVVVRDVEVPISDENESQQSIENNRLFVPTIFTASTASSISVQTAKKSTIAENSVVTETENSKFNSNNNEVSDVTAKITISPNTTVTDVSENSSTFVPKVATTSTSNEIEQSKSNENVNDEIEKPVTPVASIFEENTIVSTPIAPTSVNTASKNIERDTTITSVSTSTAQTHNSTPTRSLSSMLQSVQGLKMGFERSANQQTFITVALPISEVERLVVANPEVFATLGNSSTSNNETSTDVETNDFVNDKIVSPTVNTVSTNLQVNNEFIPTSFETITNSNNQATRNSSQRTNSFTPVVQAKSTSNTIPTIVENAKPNITEGTETIENSTASARIATLASRIETFATNLQSISSPTSNVTVSTNETETKTTSTTGQEFIYKATVETVSEKRTIIIEPVEKENPIASTIASKKNITEPNRTISELLQDADSEGRTIESLVVKIPVQSSKKNQTIDTNNSKPTDILKETTSDVHVSSEKTQKSAQIVNPKEVVIQKEVTDTSKNVSQPIVQITNKDTELPQQSTVVSLKRDTIQAKDFSSVLQRIENIKQKNTTAPELHSKPVPTSNVENIITETSKSVKNIVNKDNAVETVADSKTEVKAVSNNGNPIVQNTFEKVIEITKVDSKVTPSNTKSTSNVEPKTFKVQNKVENNIQLGLTETNVSFEKSETISTTENKIPVLQNKVNTIVELEKSALSTVSIQNDLPESNISETSNVDGETKENIISLANTVTTPIKSTEQIVIPTSTTEQPKQVTVEELPQAIVKEFVSEKTTNGSKATFSLNPEQLGTVTVKIDLQGNNASITLESSQKETIPMLEKQLDQLKEQLKTSNIIVEKLDVIFKPAEVTQSATLLNDTFTNSQQMEQKNLQQEIDRRQQNRQQHTSQTNDNENIEEVQPRQFGDGSSIIEEYI